MIKFSIIVVSYNGEKYIDNCISNILKQKFKNYEIIFVDDGSTDNTKKIINKYKEIKYYKIKHQGVSAARNYGIKKVSGKYFIFIDVDDYVDDNMLNIFEKNTKEDIDLIKFGYKIVNKNNVVLKEFVDNNSDVITGTEAFKTLCNKKNPFDMICIYLYNTQYWIKNGYSFKEKCYHEDFGIIPYALLKSDKVKILKCAPYYYVQTENSITRNSDDLKTIKKAYDYLKHYDFLYNKVNNNIFDSETTELFNSYIANGLVLKIFTIKGKERKKYINELRKRKVFDNIQTKTLISKLKKILLKINPNLYYIVLKVIK